MGIRKASILGAALLGAAAFAYASFAQHLDVDPTQAAASLAATDASDEAYDMRMENQRPRECDRFRNIDTDCTYE